MSAIGDAFKALKEVLLLQSRLDQLDQRMVRMGGDVGGLTDAVADVRDRVARLEGMLEGLALASAARGGGAAMSPRIEG